MPIPRKISSFKPLLTNLAQTSHYQVVFTGLQLGLQEHLILRGIDSRFISDSVGLLCSSASLPGSSFATSDIVGNYMGVSEKFAHTRIFTQIDFEFYVDTEYKSLKFLEHWMEYISNGSTASTDNAGYYFRMMYPTEYKTNQVKVIKFERDYKRQLEYTFYGLFPIALNSTVVTYQNSDILKASATFNYERYVCGPTLSLNRYQNTDNNKDPSSINQYIASPNSFNSNVGPENLIYRNLNVLTGQAVNPTPPGGFGNNGSVNDAILGSVGAVSNSLNGTSSDIGTRRVL